MSNGFTYSAELFRCQVEPQTALAMVSGGYNSLIPSDEATETTFRVVQQLPSELRCTCKGGLCYNAFWS